jgi:hypothetical protein
MNFYSEIMFEMYDLLHYTTRILNNIVRTY